ncbi:MAG TPA: phosphatase domain-containing protein [Thermohalobaculum sp.]|nr:phosphatase domain-containing protein [Thermohalobaculum sp.]
MPRSLRLIASSVEEGFDRARMHLRRLTGLDDPVHVQVYRGHGTRSRVIVSGSVFIAKEREPKRFRPAILTDLRATLGRYIERGVMGARLTVSLGGAGTGVTSDSDGFFEAALDVDLPAEDRVLWPEVTVRLEDFPGSRQPPSEHSGEVLVPGGDADIGLVSDIDDTVMRTGVHDLRRNWRQAIRSDPELREAFPGLAELYLGMTHDERGVQRRPVFYVSSAAWGFYPLFRDFMALRDVPAGPLFLKNYGLDRNQWFVGGHRAHKAQVIERLLAFYPRMRFVLVGDSGQQDARIYADIVSGHPERILAVWIRDVANAPERRAEVADLVDELKRTGVRAAFGPNLVAAARQAAEEGWMPRRAVEPVVRAVEAAASADAR